MTADSLATLVRSGDPRAIARAISLVEDESAEAAALISSLYTSTGRAYVIGITGAPGSGKSTLVDRLVAVVRRSGRTVGVLAIDPTSPFTGGAILGDRVRMVQHAGDAGVFIRSMATRGHLGGLARATTDAALILDAAGVDVIIIETVGVGQDEVDVVRTADVSIVVLVPGAGDDIQAIKAGLMEIADIFVVNKVDREGADRVVQAVVGSQELETLAAGAWRPPIVKCEATTGAGVDELWASIGRFRDHCASVTPGRERRRQEVRVRELIARSFLQHVDRTVEAEDLRRTIDAVAERRLDPYSAATAIMNKAMRA